MDLRRWTPTLLATALLVAVVPLTYAGGQKDDTSNPANKTAAAGSTLEYIPADWADDDDGAVILSTYVKSGGPADLLLRLSLECSLLTETVVTTIADHPDGLSDTSEAAAHILVWVTIDGKAVPVSGNDDGRVTFCDRVQRQSLEDMDESTGNWTMRTHLATKASHAFNWVTFDVGSGTHLVEVLADIDAKNTEGAYAEGVIGKRTLIVETTRFPNGSTI